MLLYSFGLVTAGVAGEIVTCVSAGLPASGIIERWSAEGRLGLLNAEVGKRPLEPVAGCADTGTTTVLVLISEVFRSEILVSDVLGASVCEACVGGGFGAAAGTLIVVSILSCLALIPESRLVRTLVDCLSAAAGTFGGACAGAFGGGGCITGGSGGTAASFTVVNAVALTDILRLEKGPADESSVALVPTVVRCDDREPNHVLPEKVLPSDSRGSADLDCRPKSKPSSMYSFVISSSMRSSSASSSYRRSVSLRTNGRVSPRDARSLSLCFAALIASSRARSAFSSLMSAESRSCGVDCVVKKLSLSGRFRVGFRPQSFKMVFRNSF